MRLVLTRAVEPHQKGAVVELPVELAARWLEAGLARPEGAPEPRPAPPVKVHPDVEVLGSELASPKRERTFPEVLGEPTVAPKKERTIRGTVKKKR